MGVESEKFETSVPSSENQNFNWSRTGEGILYGINFRYIYGFFLFHKYSKVCPVRAFGSGE